MTEKQIKKVVELAEGFEIFYDDLEDIYIRLSNNYLRWVSILNITEWEHYPLLLYRAMEGFNLINIEDDYKYINIDADIIDYSNGVNSTWRSGLCGSQRLWYKNYTPNVYLTTQEKALEAALWDVLYE